ncbi:MAG: hypothetical protein ACK4M9_10515 [Anaerobacillus sp.]|uniref:hypothetical protein n=1 Tax=Anaerobacillus sp. TaxID=1872506 RepID=UPI00391D63A8
MKKVQVSSTELSDLKLGVWIDGLFTWLDEDGWVYDKTKVNEQIKVFTNVALNLSVTIKSNFYEETLLQVMTIQNGLHKERDIKLFFCQELMETKEESISFYAPSAQAIVRSYQKKLLLLNGKLKNRGIVQYSTDFEDQCSLREGYVMLQPFSISSQVSIFSIEGEIKANEKVNAYFWLCIGNDEEDVLRNNAVTQLNLSCLVNNETECLSRLGK